MAQVDFGNTCGSMLKHSKWVVIKTRKRCAGLTEVQQDTSLQACQIKSFFQIKTV